MDNASTSSSRTPEETASGSSPAVSTTSAENTKDDTQDLLVEEVSIDGMCGVY